MLKVSQIEGLRDPQLGVPLSPSALLRQWSDGIKFEKVPKTGYSKYIIRGGEK